MRFYLTTAIDYVNSRPHLGTAYEKITADVIARYKRLVRRRHPFRDGQRRALAERLQAGARARRGAARVLRPDGAGVPRRLGAAGRSRSTTSSGRPAPRHRAGVQQLVAALSRRGRRLRRATTRAGSASRARRSSRRRTSSTACCPVHLTTAGLDPREELLLPALEVPGSAARALRGAPGVPAAGDPPQRDRPPARGRPRRHLDQPRRPALGHPAPVRRAERRLRLVRRADQLRVGRGLRRPTSACSRAGGPPTCTSSARTSRGSTA